MNKQASIFNHQHLNKKKNELVENSKNNRLIGSSTYSKNKKLLDKMLRDYQSFCKKYFGESTPIGSMTEERMNKLLEEEQYDKNQKNKNILGNNNDQFCDTFKDKNDLDEFDFETEIVFDDISKDFPFSENNRLGQHKNNKNDYKRRNLKLFKVKENKENKEKVKNEEKKENEKEEIEKIKDEEEYDDFENEAINEENKNKKASLIQKTFRKRKNENKNRIYFGYDKIKENILWVYTDKIDSKDNIKSLNIKLYSLSQNKLLYYNKEIKDLLNVDFISKEKIKTMINDVIEKINEIIIKEGKKNQLNKNAPNNEISKEVMNDEKVLDDDGEEYTF